MLLYITVGSNDIPRATRFYDAVLPTVGVKRLKTVFPGLTAARASPNWLLVTSPFSIRISRM